jgi:1,4-alpha-glucan branching enzyme
MRGTVAGARLRSDQASVELTIFGLARWRLRLNTDARIYGEDFSDHPSADVTAVPGELHDRPCRAEVTVGPYSVLVFSQDREDSEAAG